MPAQLCATQEVPATVRIIFNYICDCRNDVIFALLVLSDKCELVSVCSVCGCCMQPKAAATRRVQMIVEA